MYIYIYIPIINRKPFKLQTRVCSNVTKCPFNKTDCHIGTLTKAINWKHTRM